jgi:hypothetical protein
MSYLLHFTFALGLSGWLMPQCPRDLIYQKVDKLVKKHKIDLNFKKKIKETTCCYIVEYWPKDTMTLGGGIKAIVCKQNCEVINYQLYQ